MSSDNKHLVFPRDSGVRGAGWGGNCPPVIGKSVNPIPIRGADYAHHIDLSLPNYTFWCPWEPQCNNSLCF